MSSDSHSPLRRSGNASRNAPWRAAAIIVVIVVAIALGGYWLAHRTHVPVRGHLFGRHRGGVSSMAMPVGTATAQRGDLAIYLDALGTVTPLRTVVVRSQVSGQLLDVHFAEGQHVTQGDLLAEIDPRPFQAQMTQAEGALARDQALLANAKRDLARYRDIVKQGLIPKQQLDTQASLVRQYTGTVQADRGQIAEAKLNLGYSRITAPIGGRIGLRQVDPGNYVQAGDAGGIAVITQLQPVDVLFTIPESDLEQVLTHLRAGDKLAVDAFDRERKTKLASGTLASLDNQIDTSTGTLKAKAEFANADERLFPNQFVNVRVRVDTLRDATLIPDSALQRGADGAFVFVVKPDRSVEQRKIVVGPSEGDRVAVTRGVEPGDIVVTDGADKLREGSKVELPGDAPPVAAKPADGEGHGHWRGRRAAGADPKSAKTQ